MATKRQAAARRGVLLLIILGLLSMFGVVAIAFVVITGQYKSGAIAQAKIGERTESPEKLLNEAALQVLRGSKLANSALQPHGLLEDMYGDTTAGQLTADATDAGSGLIEFPMPQAHLRTGRWLTLLTLRGSGTRVAQSRLIRSYRVATSGGGYAVYAQMESFVDPSSGNATLPQAGDRYVVYSAPWQGAMFQAGGSSPPYYVRSVVNGQMMEFTALSPPPAERNDPLYIPLSTLHGFVGCVLTMRSGPAAGRSTRIIGFSPAYDPSNGQPIDGGHLRILAFDGVNTGEIVQYVQNGNRCDYTINGVPFSGSGAGLNADAELNPPSNQRLGASDSNIPHVEYALTPNPAAFTPSTHTTQGPIYVDPAGPGGANEGYDAVDYQNMLLSTGCPIDINNDGIGDTFIPSLHRPELVRYWLQVLFNDPSRVGFTWSWPSGWSEAKKWKAILQPAVFADAGAMRDGIVLFKRKFILRPLTDVHPDFNGSNAFSRQTIPSGLDDVATLMQNYYWELNGPWDVDNDGDGRPDSIWVDLGSPVRATRDGRHYKPLFAILCTDLDGRLNLNAHGGTIEMANGYSGNSTGPYASASSAMLPRGSGYGPPDVRLSRMFGPSELQRLLCGDTGLGYEGRYGETLGANAQAGITLRQGALSMIKHFEFPMDYTQFASMGLTAFGSPPDMWGRGTLGLDYRGQPFYSYLATTNETLNTPYELNLMPQGPSSGLMAGTANDNPFTVYELERVLRPFDVDAAELSARLVALAPSILTTQNRRHEVTTHSFDLPCPNNTLVPNGLEAYLPPGHARTVTDLLRARIMLARNLTPESVPSATVEEEITQQMAQLLSWDLLANLRMNINRPLGNGRDDNGNGTVDEPQEAGSEAGWKNAYDIFTGTATTPVPFYLGNGVNYFKPDCIVDVNGDSKTDSLDQRLASQGFARQLYARHLFVLAMLLWDANYIQPVTSGSLDNMPEANGGLSESQKRELTIRRLAQWAVNVVDFRDSDAIMTPFEYVLNPFDGRGWNIDGDVTTDETQLTGVRENPNRRVVWGCEAPEMLLTEAFALHDRRMADTDFDTSGEKRFKKDASGKWEEADNDLDQARIPQGSAFFEFYCTRNINNAVAPSELYTYNSNDKKWYLDLGRLAPAGSDGLQYPVWRVVIGKSNLDRPNNDLAKRLGIRGTLDKARPDSASTETEQVVGTPIPRGEFNLLNAPPTEPAALGFKVRTLEIDRIVWFTDQSPVKPVGAKPSHKDWDRIFYNRQYDSKNKPALLRYLEPGKYFVAGPRVTTSIGATTTLGKPSQREIELVYNPNNGGDALHGNRNGIRVVNAAGTNKYPNYDASASDPEIQIPEWMIVASSQPDNWANNSGAAPTGIGVSVSEPLFSSNYYDEPKVKNDQNGLIDAYGDLTQADNTKPFLDKPLDSSGDRPLNKENADSNPLTATATYEDFKTVLLQRLANPLAPFDPVANPYRTVDWTPIDLTVFNGEDRPNYDAPPPDLTGWDPDDPGDRDTKQIELGTRQRGGNNDYNLWAQSWDNLPDPARAYGAGTDIVTPELVDRHTLGYLNSAFGTPAKKSQIPNASYAVDHYGDPQQPFPWLTWQNRPFVSPMELMVVPTSHPGRLCYEFSLVRKKNATDAVNPYEPGDPKNPGTLPLQKAFGFGFPFGQLANFFSDTETPDGAAHLYRVLEYVQVPSRFVGTERLLNPGTAAFGNVDNANNADTALFRPPFSMVSEYREPGRVNINTVFSQTVWNAVLGGFSAPNYQDLFNSRQGATAADLPGYPTLFTNPFRSPGSGHFVPSLKTGATALDKRSVNIGLLRARSADPTRIDDDGDAANFGREPLFFDPSRTAAYNRNDRNPYFCYQDLEHLSNLVTTRSNVYAVWITVGYFEASPITTAYNPAVYPDGYTLGVELGSDTGEIKRHRAFYIFDRSIPAGFIRGEDLNVGNCVLLRRYLE
jgi:hypothetical protein